MVRLTSAFKLYQPWADEVANGALPYLVRQINTNKRNRVGIFALDRVDQIWQRNADIKWKNLIMENIGKGLIGSVKIIDTICVKKSDIESKLIQIAGEDYLNDYYPKYLIPASDPLYIWILKKPKKWKKFINPNKIGGINWISIDVNDR